MATNANVMLHNKYPYHYYLFLFYYFLSFPIFQILSIFLYEATGSIIAAYYWWSFPEGIGINPLEWAPPSK